MDPEKFKEIQDEIENFFPMYEKMTGEDLLSSYKANNLFEEFTNIFVEIYDVLFSIHRGDIFNFLMYLLDKDKIPPANKQDVENFRNEIHNILKEYKFVIDRLVEENY